jgi:hypothetical protein
VKIGPPDDAPERANVLFLATHHAREWIATAVAMKLIRWLADSAGMAVATHDVWVIPVENPDGYQYSFTNDRYWRKNRRPNADGTFGVDPNRNYPAFWGVDDRGSSGVQFAETYRGASAGSEPETQAVMAFHAVHRPVVAISYHSYSGLILYPWGFSLGRARAGPAAVPGARRYRSRPRDPGRPAGRDDRSLPPRTGLESVSDERRVHRLGVSDARHARVHGRADEWLLRERSGLRIRIPRRQRARRAGVSRQLAVCAVTDRGIERCVAHAPAAIHGHVAGSLVEPGCEPAPAELIGAA